VALPFLLAAALGAAACTSAGPAPPSAPTRPEPRPLDLPAAERPFVVDPLQGYPREVDPARRGRVEEAFRALLDEGDVIGARQTAAELAREAPGFHPAQVLAAQAAFAAGENRAVIERLLPLGDELPGYTASQLLLGRAAERAGDVPLAYAAFRSVASRSPAAFQRAGELHPRAVEIVSRRFGEALRQGEIAEAERQLALLSDWAPGQDAALEAARALAAARGDRRAELAAVREIAAARPDDRALLERRAELELEVGDPGQGLAIAREIAARHPDDPRAAERLESAKFRWRLTLLPAAVREVAAAPELTKGDLAVLLYWLVPDIRTSRPSSGRIATDVLDHPHKEEIVRVAGLGLMEVDPTLHRFSPGAPVRQSGALRVLFRILASFGGAGEQGICTGGPPAGGNEAVCEAAAACGLLPGLDACRPGEPLSGSEALELIRRTLDRLGPA
jgi:hypothetical protein